MDSNENQTPYRKGDTQKSIIKDKSRDRNRVSASRRELLVGGRNGEVNSLSIEGEDMKGERILI